MSPMQEATPEWPRCVCGRRLTVRPRFIQTEPSRPEESGTLHHCLNEDDGREHTRYVVPFKSWREKRDGR